MKEVLFQIKESIATLAEELQTPYTEIVTSVNWDKFKTLLTNRKDSPAQSSSTSAYKNPVSVAKCFDWGKKRRKLRF